MEKKEVASVKKEKKKNGYSVLVKANKKGKHINPFMNFIRALIIPFYYLVRPFRYYGNKKIADGACVYVCNHYTFLDAIFVAATTWEQIHIIAKREVGETPVVGAVARGVKAIFVNRDGNDVRALLDSFKCLKNGEKIAVFPEGTRNKTADDGEMLPFKHGASVMAIRAKAPVLPMVIYKRPRFFRCAHILIGEPFELTEYYDKKLSEEEYAEADEKIRQRMIEMREKHTEYLLSKKKKGKKA